MEYNALDEVMSYFYYEFNIYIILLLIVLLGAVKALFQLFKSWKTKDSNNSGKNDHIFDILSSLLAILALSNAAVFQGVLSDIPVESAHQWIDKSFQLIIATALIFSVQLACILLKQNRNYFRKT